MNLKYIKFLTITLILILSCKLEPSNEEPPPVDTTPPHIMVVYPANDAIGVSVTNSVSVTFSEPMDKTSAQGAFSLSDGATPVAGTFSWSDDTMTFDPSSNLSCSIKYYVKVTTSAKDTSGNSVASEFNSSFITAAGPDTTPPSITAVSPVDLATDVPITANVSVTFSEQMEAAASQNAFTLSAGVTAVSGTFNWSGNTMIFDPSTNLSYSTTYSVKVTTSAKDTSGNPLVSESNSSFTTALEPNVYVSSSGSDSNAGTPDSPLLTLSAGVALAQTRAPTEVRVEGSPAGILYDLGSVGLIIPAGVSLMGGYNSSFSLRDSKTYISKITSTNTYTILFDGSTVTNGTVLDGFSITNTATFDENVYTIYCKNFASPKITNNKIRNEATNVTSSNSNSAASACIYSDQGSPLIEVNEIRGGSGTAIIYAKWNAGSTGIYCYHGTPMIRNNTSIEGGTGTAKDVFCAGSAGIYCMESDATIIGNLSVVGGSGNALLGRGECAGSVGIYCYQCSPTIQGNKLIEGGSGAGRDAVGSAGIYLYESGSIGCPIIENNESIAGGSGSSTSYISAGSAGIAGRGCTIIRNNLLIDGGSGSSTGEYKTVGSAGIYWYGGEPNIEYNVSIYGGSGSSIGYFGAGSAGIHTKNATGIIRGNKMINGGSGSVSNHDSAGSAGVFCGDGTICDNIEINGGSGTATDYDSAGAAGIYCTDLGTGGGNIVILNNLIVVKSGSATAVDAGIDTVCIWFDNISSGKVANNTLVYKSPNEYSIGIFVKVIADVRIANNIIFSAGGTNRFGIYERSSYDPTIVMNNLIFDCPTGLYYDEGTTAITNIDGVNALAECSNNITTTQSLSQLFVDGSPFNYHLTSGSDAIDAGYNTSSSYWGGVIVDADGETRPKGSAYDIGFDEY